jgi:hypothetical protein
VEIAKYRIHADAEMRGNRMARPPLVMQRPHLLMERHPSSPTLDDFPRRDR